jgi:2-keto-3-deoxy-L-rhamnonate aldolase RhmA
MKTRIVLATTAFIIGRFTVAAPDLDARQKHVNAVIDLWSAGKTAFGVFVPNENPAPRGARPETGPLPKPLYTKEGGEKLAMNPLYDYVFLNLEGDYEPAAIKAIADGLRSPKATGHKALIVRIPPIDRGGADATRARVKEAFDLGADGVTVPHVRNIDEANQVLGFFRDAEVDIWSQQNPKGEKLAMLMIEDPGALAQATAIADLEGYSILACGIGSLTQALGGNREAAEAGNQKILAETKRVRLVNMLTASPQDVERRVKEGFLALLAQGSAADETIKLGRTDAGR